MNTDDPEYFSALQGAIRDGLISDGCTVIDLPVQCWAARHSLTHASSGGGLVVAYGPVERDGGKRRLPYSVVGESATTAGEIEFFQETPAEEAAVEFVKSIEPLLLNRHPMASRVAVNVGAGLQSPGEAAVDAERKNPRVRS